ncbi:MAG TPA: DNA polymerase III subunit delta [Candidatus Saccharimonadales bacterium]|nr:DNA polymerase III subunit delta [Candidatus Saccharimonadales bacterium]
MITVITGENGFENDRLLRQIEVQFDGTPERIDGTELELKRVPDLLMGTTLFASKRLVIIKNLSENKSLWNEFEPWIARANDDVHLILMEQKPDKRTKTYKTLQKNATLHESRLWTDRDSVKAEQWATQEARSLGFELDKKSAQILVARVGVDQWQLFGALQKLAVLGEVTPEIIEEIIEANPAENVFNLFDAALNGNGSSVKHMLGVLALAEDPYRVFGLLSSQAFQLVALSLGEKSSAEVAKDLGAHPFALSKLAPHAKKMSRMNAKQLLALFVEADATLKSSAHDPWLLIERALLKVCLLGRLR